jgi:hypothetical protein
MPKRLNIEVRIPDDRNYLGEIDCTTARWASADGPPTGYVAAKSAPAFRMDGPRPGPYRMRALAEFEGRVNDPRAIQLYGPGIIFFEEINHARSRRPGIVPVHGGQLDAFGRMIQTDGGLRVTNEYMRGLLAEAKASEEVTLNIVEDHLGFIRRWFRPKVSAAVPQYPARDHSDSETSHGSENLGTSDDSTDDRPFWHGFITNSDRNEPAARSARGTSEGEKSTDWRTTRDPVLGPGVGAQEGWRLVSDDVLRAKPDTGDPVIIDPFPAGPSDTSSSRSHEADHAQASSGPESVEMAPASPADESPSSSGTSY